MNRRSNPLNEKQVTALNELVKDITTEQIIWLSGYLEGRISGLNGSPAITETSETETAQKTAVANLTIIYGTETGNAIELAQKMKEKALFKDVAVNLLSMYDYDPENLQNEENLAIIVSTHGEGEPPDMAEDFHKYVTTEELPKLNNLRFSVLALGDKTYRNFCQTGEEIFNAIKQSGAQTATQLVMCDVDYELKSEIWMNTFLLNLTPAKTTSVIEKTAPDTVIQKQPQKPVDPTREIFSKSNPFPAVVLDKIRLNSYESDKEVYHLELSLEGSGLTYEPGDSVGIFTQNPPELVDLIIEKTGFDPNKKVSFSEDEETTLKSVLTHKYEITLVTYDLLTKYYEHTKNPDLYKLLSNNDAIDDYLYGSDLLDMLEDFPYDWNINKLLEILRPLPPRLYSVSSSMKHVDEEVHITVSVVDFERKNRRRYGACSLNISAFLDTGDEVMVYIEKNTGFRMPENGEKIIMVGAGTGIAPYRAFMQQRKSKDIIGNTWLFYGDRKSKTDFLYQNEWQELQENNILEKIDVAFSRDQEDKVYVQHKLTENKKEIFDWFENGAYFYLCGDRRKLSKNINNTLLEIIKSEGGMSQEQAEKYLKNLKREKRYQTDVY